MASIKGTCTYSHKQLNHWLHLLEVYWESDEVGDVQDVLIPLRINGNIICVDTLPGALPIADDYDITLIDELGLDVMGGTLADRDDTDAERAWPTDGTYVIRRRVYNCLTMGVENAAVNDPKGNPQPTEGYMNIYFERKNRKGV
jgi:hypothetical protein